MTAEYNLLDEKWIRVLCENYSVKEVSLIDALTNASSYRDLAGELKAQDVAVLRLLLAILHSVYSRVDKNGDPDPIEDEADALERWAEIWHDGKFRREPIERYLEKYRDRFYLFHPDHPFYQVSEAAVGTEYAASKLNGELSESSNKLRLFPVRTGELRNSVTFPEAARWLLFVNAFDDTSSKPKGKGLPSPGAGWLGKLGIVTAEGNNLFETLMLNLTLLKDGVEMWGENRPIWEMEEPRKTERTEIPVPDNQAELLTLQSRRILLKREGNRVTGYYLLGGDFFKREDAFAEQMTTWKEIRDKKIGTGSFQPKRHESSRQIWRDFAGLLVQGEGRHIPGVVMWLKRLQESGILPEGMMECLRITSVQYGDKDFFITDEFGDSLSFTGSLLTEKGETWQELIVEEIERCEKRAFYVELLAKNLVRAAGGDTKEEDSQGRQAREAFFYRMDIPFRSWLSSLTADQNASERSDKLAEWNKTATGIARRLGDEMVAECGPAAFQGRTDPDSGRHCSAPEALNQFKYQISKIEKEG